MRGVDFHTGRLRKQLSIFTYTRGFQEIRLNVFGYQKRYNFIGTFFCMEKMISAGHKSELGKEEAC